MYANKYSLSYSHTDTHRHCCGWVLYTGIRWISKEHAGKVDEVSRPFDLSYHTDSAQLSAALLASTAFL